MIINDYLFWKAIIYAFFAAIELATTPIVILLIVALRGRPMHINPDFYSAPFLIIVAFIVFFPIGVFAEFLSAESEHLTIAEFSAESIALDLKIIKMTNLIYLCIVLSIIFARFIFKKYQQKFIRIA